MEDLSPVAQLIDPQFAEGGDGRVQDTWLPLLELGRCYGLDSWVRHTEEVIKKEMQKLRNSQGYDADTAVLIGLDAASRKPLNPNERERVVFLSDVKKAVRAECDLKLKLIQIEDVLQDFGVSVSLTHGRKTAKVDAQVEKLLRL